MAVDMSVRVPMTDDDKAMLGVLSIRSRTAKMVVAAQAGVAEKIVHSFNAGALTRKIVSAAGQF
jgi:hypothetical protein